MRLADDARKCVAYLGYRASDNDFEIEPIGTGFVISADRRNFLVTARHVAEDFKSDPFVVRLNDKNGVGKNDHVDMAEWFFHPNDNNIDVAILEYTLPDWADCVVFPRPRLHMLSRSLSARSPATLVEYLTICTGRLLMPKEAKRR